jgi:hypothetical protein
MKLIKIFFAAAILTFSVNASAQRTTARTAAKPVPVKPPKLTASIGNFRDTMSIAVKDAGNIVGLPLKITDDKGTLYQISSYRFLYRQVVTSEDEQTGKPYSTYAVKSSLFTTTPLPPVWINMLQERLRAGEEFIFFDVIGKNAKGQVFYASDIKLTLK